MQSRMQFQSPIGRHEEWLGVWHLVRLPRRFLNFVLFATGRIESRKARRQLTRQPDRPALLVHGVVNCGSEMPDWEARKWICYRHRQVVSSVAIELPRHSLADTCSLQQQKSSN